MNARGHLNLDALPERAPFGDPDARAARAELQAAESARSARNIALSMAEQGPVSAELLASASLCTGDTAHTTLSNLRAEGKLRRVARGWYELPGKTKQPERQGGMVSAARADRREKEAQLSAAEAFFATKEPLPKHPPPDFEAPLRRRRA